MDSDLFLSAMWVHYKRVLKRMWPRKLRLQFLDFAFVVNLGRPEAVTTCRMQTQTQASPRALKAWAPSGLLGIIGDLLAKIMPSVCCEHCVQVAALSVGNDCTN